MELELDLDLDAVYEDLARTLQVIGESEVLRARFCELAGMTAQQRIVVIELMASQMAAEHESPALIGTLRLFADSRVFDAALATLKKCGYIPG